jgi:acetylxylan esterase
LQPHLPSPPSRAATIFLARGHGEAIPGGQTVIFDAICSGYFGSCGKQSIAYNATDNSPDKICQSQYEGIMMAKDALAEYETRCSDAKLVLNWWSQGGALITDVVAGGGGINLTGTCDQPISDPLRPDGFPGKRIAAVVTYGELHHNANQSWNFGNGSAMNGMSFDYCLDNSF